MRQIKHEIKNNLLALQILMKDKQYEKAEAYLNEITSNTEKITGVNYCENLLINAVVGDLLQAGASKGIAVDFAVNVPEMLNISETDLYCLFSNIFRNAVESCERVTNTANRFITLNVRVKAPYLYISAINSKQHDIISINGTDRILSTKEDAENHGFGLWTISQIVKKHDGMLDINHDEHTFSIAVAVKVVDCV